MRELSALREKCQALEGELAKHAPQDGEGEKLLRLEGEIEELQRQAEEQSARRALPSPPQNMVKGEPRATMVR